MNPVVTISLMVDFWLSADFVTCAFMLLTQTDDYGIYLTACLYLSRTVRFAYGAMKFTSFVLKRLGKEKYFSDMDPTIVAVALSTAARPLTSLQFRVYFLFSIYRFHFTFMLSTEQKNEGLEMIFKRKDIVVAFAKDAIFGRTIFATPTYNDWKHQFLLWCIGRYHPSGTCEAFGGGIDELFTMNRKHKRNIHVSQRGADCYIIFKEEKTTVSVYLSLLICLDLNHISLIPSMGNMAVGNIEQGTEEVAVNLGSNGCRWIM
ncbi:hypothetical protein THRCLA_20984 [Thraustotheca clavata]|uniref:Uncharacterized protein n=1 Tax=Thraustotheca clavata TaxID=74557 RepID=A0A1W0A220_9STRA|nr:hypothetical protein THRCLA_20984 [Thraustotheca clavata]